MRPIFRKKGGRQQDDRWQTALEKAFEAPVPLRREKFMEQMLPPAHRSGDFLLVQFLYIRKRVWIFSALLFAAVLYASLVLSADTLWSISAFTPLLALLMVAETGRSERFEMAELEMATRFSLKSVLLARLGILGLGNVLLLGALVPIGLFHSKIPPVQAGLYIVTPFLLTTFLCLHIVRRYREREGIYLCTGVSACIGVLVYSSRLSFQALYEESFPGVWFSVSVLLIFCILRQYRSFLLREELS